MTHTIRIGLDAHMVGSQETGNETYVKGLVDGFSQLERNYELLVYYQGGPWRDGTHQVQLRALSGSPAALRLSLDLPLRSIKDRLDVLHTTYTTPPWSRGQVVVTVHDVTFVTNPEWFSKRDLLVLSLGVRMAVQRAARVITVSNICREQILEHYRLPPEKVVTVPIAAGAAGRSIELSAARQELKAIGLDPERPYVLAVGNLQPRKNLLRLVEAFQRVVANGVDADLVLVGPRHYRADEVMTAARGTANRVRFTGYIGDRQLAACYQCASVFAFPSLFEGFGIPALEAMAHGVPVACSKTGALPEVCGTAARYFDPTDVDSIAAALEALFSDDALRAELVREGRAREGLYAWSRSAELTLAAYEAAVGAGASE